MEEITKTLFSPAWWFSSILVALIVNIVSSFVYERIKGWGDSLTSNRIKIFCQVGYAIAIFASSILIKPANQYWEKMIPMLGAFIALCVILDIVIQTRFRFFAMFTTFCIFCLNVVL